MSLGVKWWAPCCMTISSRDWLKKETHHWGQQGQNLRVTPSLHKAFAWHWSEFHWVTLSGIHLSSPRCALTAMVGLPTQVTCWYRSHSAIQEHCQRGAIYKLLWLFKSDQIYTTNWVLELGQWWKWSNKICVWVRVDREGTCKPEYPFLILLRAKHSCHEWQICDSHTFLFMVFYYVTCPQEKKKAEWRFAV